MTSIKNQIISIRERIARSAERAGRDPGSITLVAVSKRVEASRLLEAIDAGVYLFGENYLQEAVEKVALLPKVGWHFIGGIQSNKTKLIAETFDVVETIDRRKVAVALEKQLEILGKVMPVYLQVNIGREIQKSGVLPEQVEQLVVDVMQCPHLHLAGLMAMPPYNPNPEASREYFRQMKGLADDLLQRGSVVHPLELSMGMSGDYEVAIEEGATVVRIGSALFGDRN